RPARAGGLPRREGPPRRRGVRRRVRRVRPALPARPSGRRPGRAAVGVPPEHLRGGRHDGALGSRCPGTVVTNDPECRPWVEQDEGPYHLDGEPLRQDLIEDRPGVPLRLAVRLVGDDGIPVVGAVVDVWHCDALGRYSGFGVPGDTDDDAGSAGNPTERFLRGRQRTDDDGCCEFRTIYPGWYGGRTVHIHVIAEAAGRRWTSQ